MGCQTSELCIHNLIIIELVVDKSSVTRIRMGFILLLSKYADTS